MPTCSAYNCSYKHKNFKTSGKTVHTFPFSRPEILARWIVNIRRKDWHPSKRSVLCSDHFEPDAFDRSGLIVRLKPEAVPTIFAFPSHLTKKSKKRKAPSKHDAAASSQPAPSHQELNDHSYSTSPQKLKRKLKRTKSPTHEIKIFEVFSVYQPMLFQCRLINH